MLKNSFMKLKSNRVFREIIFWLIVILFGLCFFSIPTFSFLTKYYFLTWIFTIILLFVSTIYLLLFKKIVIDYINISFALFAVSALIGYLLNGFRGFVPTIFLNTFLIIMFYTLTVKEERMKSFAYFSILCGIAAFSIIYIVSYRNYLFTFNFTRLGELFGDINDIAIVLSIGFCLSLSMIFKKKKWYWILLFIFLALVFLLLSFSTGSKIVILLDAAVIIAVIIRIFGKKRWYISIGIIALVLVSGIVIINLPAFETLKDRFLNMIYSFLGRRYKNMNFDLSTSVRFDMFLNGVSMFLRRPLFGFGPSGFSEYSAYMGGWSHNHISESLCNYGIVGTMLYHIPVALYLKERPKTKNTDTEIIMLVCFFVSMISVALFGEKFFTYLIGLVLSSTTTKPIYQLSLFKEGASNENN